MGKLPKAPITSRIDKRLDFTGHLEESRMTYLYTSDPCVLDDDADLLLVADITVLDL